MIPRLCDKAIALLEQMQGGKEKLTINNLNTFEYIFLTCQVSFALKQMDYDASLYAMPLNQNTDAVALMIVGEDKDQVDFDKTIELFERLKDVVPAEMMQWPEPFENYFEQYDIQPSNCLLTI
jgi:hypothetical protein